MSESIEMYLKTLVELSIDDEPVAISNIARRLGISSVSATEMIKRLETQGLVVHTPYKGVELTEEGQHRARAVQRRHRLWEHFLFHQLGITWELSHEHACVLEHLASEEVTESLAVFLGNPERCPHGNPISSVEPCGTDEVETPLSLLSIGDRCEVIRVYPEETSLLAYLKEKSILPGKRALIEDIAPYNGPITLRIDGAMQVLGRTPASNIYTRKV